MGGDLIQTPQTRWILGAYESVQRPTIITLSAQLNQNAGGGRHTTLRQLRAVAGYVVPSNKTLYITKIYWRASAAGISWALEDGTNDVGLNSAVAPAGQTFVDDPFNGDTNILTSPAANTIYNIDHQIAIPSGRYPAVLTTAGTGDFRMLFIGHEE